LLQALTAAINATWLHRHELKPVATRRKPPRPLDVYAILPQTNCKQCGEATCMAFAFGLLMNKRKPTECPPLLNNPTYSERLSTLEALL